MRKEIKKKNYKCYKLKGNGRSIIDVLPEIAPNASIANHMSVATRGCDCKWYSMARDSFHKG